METGAATGRRVYKDFAPSSKWVREEGTDTLVIDLPEFNKEQVRVELDYSGKLSVSGERPLGDNRWSRFDNVFQVPKESNEFQARFENGRLHMKILPKSAERKEALMETGAATGRHVYKDFAPSSKWVREEGIDTLVIDLPEFNKEQVRVELDYSGKLSVSGERPLGDNRWSRFDNVFQVPKESNEFQARFENGRLHVKILPKSAERKETLMETGAATSRLVYKDFAPSSKWVREEGTNTLVIDLLEFNKEQVRVELDYSGKLSVSGERPLGDNRWSRFDYVFQVPKESNEFQARFENGRLHVKILPKSAERKEALMETGAATGRRVYKDFAPLSKWVREEGTDTLVIDLPEFNKEQVRVELDYSGKLSVSGERPLGDNQWSRFDNVFQVPKESNEFQARFENGRLHVKILPKSAERKEALMETGAATSRLVYKDFAPSSKWVREEGTDTLVIDLPEFNKEQVRVELDYSEKLSVSGERPLGDNRWIRFDNVFQVPKESNEFQARFENGRLHVKILPKSAERKEALMETGAATSRLVYKDFAPSSKWVRDEGTDTLVINLPEFNKEQVRVELDYSGKLSVSGERPLGDNRWSRFDNVFQVPKESNEFQARFENGHLHVKIFPKSAERKEALMETGAATGRRVYKDFAPSSKWVREEGTDTLVIDLPEFNKEQVRVELDYSGKLSISGERPLGDNRWSRFDNVFQVPKESNEFQARFENGRLYVKILPKSTERKQLLVNVIVAVVVLIVMALFVTSKN